MVERQNKYLIKINQQSIIFIKKKIEPGLLNLIVNLNVEILIKLDRDPWLNTIYGLEMIQMEAAICNGFILECKILKNLRIQ